MCVVSLCKPAGHQMLSAPREITALSLQLVQHSEADAFVSAYLRQMRQLVTGVCHQLKLSYIVPWCQSLHVSVKQRQSFLPPLRMVSTTHSCLQQYSCRIILAAGCHKKSISITVNITPICVNACLHNMMSIDFLNVGKGNEGLS